MCEYLLRRKAQNPVILKILFELMEKDTVLYFMLFYLVM